MPSYKELNIIYSGGDLLISGLYLDSLDGCPEHITGHFDCANNNLTSLVGGPQRVDGNYDCRLNYLTNFDGCASHFNELFGWGNSIFTLVGIHKIIKKCTYLHFEYADVKEGGIGILLISNLQFITNTYAPFEIIANYLDTGTKGMMTCSKELIAKGYANYAKL